MAERVVLPRATVARAIRVPLAAALPWSFEGCGAGADECGAQGKPRRAQAASPALPRSAADAMRHRGDLPMDVFALATNHVLVPLIISIAPVPFILVNV